MKKMPARMAATRMPPSRITAGGKGGIMDSGVGGFDVVKLVVRAGGDDLHGGSFFKCG
jgi:hypothetical protein